MNHLSQDLSLAGGAPLSLLFFFTHKKETTERDAIHIPNIGINKYLQHPECQSEVFV